MTEAFSFQWMLCLVYPEKSLLGRATGLHFMTLYFLKIKAVLMSMCQILPRLGNYTEYVYH